MKHHLIQLLLIGTLSVLSWVPSWAQDNFFPRIILKDPYETRFLFGVPQEDRKLPDGKIQWTFETPETYVPELDRTIHTTTMKVIYEEGRTVQVYFIPMHHPGSSNILADYIPADVIWDVTIFDTEDRFGGTPENPIFEAKFENAWISGRVRGRGHIMVEQSLRPNGRFFTRWNYAKIWSSDAISVEISLKKKHLRTLQNDPDQLPHLQLKIQDFERIQL